MACSEFGQVAVDLDGGRMGSWIGVAKVKPLQVASSTAGRGSSTGVAVLWLRIAVEARRLVAEVQRVHFGFEEYSRKED